MNKTYQNSPFSAQIPRFSQLKRHRVPYSTYHIATKTTFDKIMAGRSIRMAYTRTPITKDNVINEKVEWMIKSDRSKRFITRNEIFHTVLASNFVNVNFYSGI